MHSFNRFAKHFAVIAAVVCSASYMTVARAVDVVSGQTSVLPDLGTLEAAASLVLSGTSDDVLPGNLGDGSVAFAINPRNAAVLPTTFSYDPATFPAAGSFSGSIEHSGSLFFNDDAVEVGDFTIGFDGDRAGTLNGTASGFFVESNAGIAAIVFDVGAPSQAIATASDLTVAADLLVSPEFAGFLQSNGLAASDLSGADVGDALIEASSVPEPGSLLLALAGMSVLCSSRRRRVGR